MFYENIKKNVKRFHQRLNGSTIEFDLGSYQKVFREIEKLKKGYENKSDDQLKSISQRLRERAKKSDCLDALLVDAFALVRETTWRILRLQPFDVQIFGGIVMHQGKLAEMQTGEGKTLAAIFPVYLNALTGNGVHVLTFNDYLARRDAQWMGPIYEFLGLSVGFVQEGMSIMDRQKAYQSDITYLTAKESGFDYLRDNLCYDPTNIVHRPFNYSVIDEADSILIDEARIPLVIAGSAKETIADPYFMAQLARQLEMNIDFKFDQYARNFQLTPGGIERVESILKCDNLFDEKNLELLTRLNCAIHAESLLHRDVDYIVRNNKIELVDEFTGRVADKRRWPDGLQAALEAKENIDIQTKGHILNSITLQHFLQLYPKISGMTATAQSAEQEFKQFYNLDIVVIPPNKKCIRVDHGDFIFQTKAAKQQALLDEIIRVHKTGRPILVGTRSVEESSQLAVDLKKMDIPCQVLNAKRDEYEAQIIAQAGRLGAVTISTNMAGRGTDILLGAGDEDEKKQVAELGGLYVIGTNKHESQRIDKQLRGRAGRQGDPGTSRFFVSLEDDLFVKYHLNELLPSSAIFLQPDGKIENPLANKEINRVQRIIEGQHLEIKKTMSVYSSLIEDQRKIIFQKRKEMLFDDSVVVNYVSSSQDQFERLKSQIGENKLRQVCKQVSLFCLDEAWARYLAEIADIREGIHLTRLGGQKPVLIFQKRVIEVFDALQEAMEKQTIRIFEKLQIRDNQVDLDSAGLKAPSSTWTYLINDNQFEDMLSLELIGNVGLSAVAGLMWPLIAPFLALNIFVKKQRRKKLEASLKNK